MSDMPQAQSAQPESQASFVHLHVHTQYSLLEGAVRVKPLLKKAAEMGMPAIAITDTNNLFGAIDFYFAAKDAGVKPIIGCEILFAPEGRHAALNQAAAAAKGAPGASRQNFKPRYHHLTVLCKDLKGYRNLCQLITAAYLDAPPPQKGQPAGPRELVDRELLDKWGDGLVVLSGCMRSEITYKIITGDEASALESVMWFKKRFGDDFYLELQDGGIPEQENANAILYDWGQKHGIECVASVDVHYLNASDAEAHEVLQCIQNGRNLDFERPKSLVPPEFHVKSPAEMRARFERFPGACDNTLKIADKCDVQFKFKDESGKPIYHLPNYRPDGVSKEDEFDLLQYFRDQSRLGLEERFTEPALKDKRASEDWPRLEKVYRDRLEEELDIIAATGFAGYFLIVSDFIKWALANDIPVGPGRGSGAGSLVAYCLRITNIDPILFDLLFERFLNPERISMPDFDIDFCQDRRGEVIDYVGRKYGRENVCQIITFGKLQARAVIKDVGRVMGLTFADTDELTKLLPDELNIKLKDAIEREPRLREKIETEPKVRKLFEYALALEGLYRNAGVHAAGVIITEEPVVTYSPLFKAAEGDVVTQFDKDFSEKIGLVKFDFLGLKTLTVISNAVKNIIQSAEPGSEQEKFSIEAIPYDDSKVYDLISSGDTDGIFQIESSGMKDLCSRLRPTCIEDLTAINALYRPGPLGSGMVDTFIDCKHGRQEIQYPLPQLEPILKETYGVILYQEQVMQIARVLGGYSLGQADMLRRAMGKKKPEEMAKHREIFCKGAAEQSIPAEKAESIFDLMAKFAEYGFNKSHSAAYAVISYQTAYLKCYYPAQFMAALMTTEMSNTEKLSKYIADARAHHIPVLPPDVNRSQKKFSVEKIKPEDPLYPKGRTDGQEMYAIRFGLEAIKGVGGIAVDVMVEVRGDGPGSSGDTEQVELPAGVERGPFKGVLDFCKRVPTRKVNKKVLESLIHAGAFDSIAEVNRPSLLASLETLVEHAADEQEERALGQSSLFDAFSAEEIKLVTPTSQIFKEMEDWPLSKKLIHEKQVCGFYVSGHPMDSWQSVCEDWLGWNTERLKKHAAENPAPKAPQGGGGYGQGGQRPQRKEIRIAGIFAGMREVTTKRGSRMAFAQFEDLYGQVEVVFFPDPYTENQEILKAASAEAEAVIVTAELEVREGDAKLLAKSIQWARDAHQGRAKEVILKLEPAKVSVEQLRELKQSLIAHRGKCPVTIYFEDPKFRTHMKLPNDLCVEGSPKLVAAVNRVFGAPVVELR